MTDTTHDLDALIIGAGLTGMYASASAAESTNATFT